MVHNLTQGLLDIVGSLGGLGKTKVSTLANAIVDGMDEENELRKIVINQVMRDALVAMLFRENASADIIGATLVSSTVALLYIQELGNLNIDSALLNKIINIVFSKLSVNVEDIKALLTQVNIDITLVKNIREVAIAPSAGQSFAAKLVIEGVDLSTLSNIQRRVFVANILKIYAQQKKLDLSKIGIVVSLNNGSSVRKAQMVSKREVGVSVIDPAGVAESGATVITIEVYELGSGAAAALPDDGAAAAWYNIDVAKDEAGALAGVWVALDAHQLGVAGSLGDAAVWTTDEVEDADFSVVKNLNELSFGTINAMTSLQWGDVSPKAFGTMSSDLLEGVPGEIAATWSPAQVAEMPEALQVQWEELIADLGADADNLNELLERYEYTEYYNGLDEEKKAEFAERLRKAAEEKMPLGTSLTEWEKLSDEQKRLMSEEGYTMKVEVVKEGVSFIIKPILVPPDADAGDAGADAGADAGVAEVPDAGAAEEPGAGASAEAASLSIVDYESNVIALQVIALKNRAEFGDDIKNLSIEQLENYIIGNWVMNVNNTSYILRSNSFKSDDEWLYVSTTPNFTPGEDKSGVYDVLFTKKAA